MRRIAYSAVIALLMFGSVPAFALTWNIGDPGTTHQEWYFGTDATRVEADVYDNAVVPEAEVKANNGGSISWDPAGFWFGDSIRVNLYVPNIPVPNELKEIHVEFGFRGIRGLRSVIPQENADSIEVISEEIETQGDWQILRAVWQIKPNPSFEDICYAFSGDDNVVAALDYAIVSTICIPEPASICLLTLGGLALFHRRKRS